MRFYTRSLNISHKLWLSVLSFSIPILMLLYFTVSGINYDINFARLELLGNRVLEPLNQLLLLVPQHQILVTTDDRAGNRSARDELESVTNLITQNIEILTKETQAIGEPLKITPTSLKEAGVEQLIPANIADRWQKIRRSNTGIQSQKLEQQYDDLKQNIRELIARIGNTSNLILDPDLDSYYLMDITLLAIPQVQQRMGEILLLMQKFNLQKQLSNETKLKLAVYASSLSENLARIKQNISTSVQEDKSFYGVSPSLEKNIPPVFTIYENAVNNFNERVIQLTVTNQKNIQNQEFFDLGNDVMRKGSELWYVTRSELDKLLDRRIEYYERRRFNYLALSLTALFISVFFVFKISREIIVRLTGVVAITKEVALGNLTTRVRVDSQDEIGQLLGAVRYMIENLNSLIKQMQEIGIQVASSATELLATAKQQEITIENLVKKMDRVAAISKETAEFASSGRSDLVLMKESMQEMENASDRISSRLKAIDRKAEKITVIVTTITNVAAQTNLLSLNAAIEAEKAGEYGRGFAVVAGEIRRLADLTAVATLDIERMIKEMKLVVLEGMMEMESFITKVDGGVANINQISTQFAKIIEQVEALLPTFEGVNVAVVQQIKNSLHETYIAIEQLNVAAIGLRERVSRFQVNGGIH